MRDFYKSNTLLIAICVLITMLVGVDIYVFRSEPVVFWITLPFLLGVSGLTLGKLLQIRQSEYRYFERLSQEIRNTNSISLTKFPLPVCIVDDNRSVIWSNEKFNVAFFRPNEDTVSIDTVTDMPLELYGTDGRELKYGESWYRLYSVNHEYTLEEKNFGKPTGTETVSESITMLIFRDITDYKMLQHTYEITQPIVMVVMVDNYEELLSGAKESERAYVTIQVDRLIEEYFAEKKAVLQKLSVDKFLIVLEQQYLDEMIADKMALINKAHEIIVLERAAVTLSIGVGTTASSLAEGERFANEMLGKALERGGDQALVKTENGFNTFGAISPGRERTGKVKIRLAAEDIKDLVGTADTVYIMGHSFGDFDSAGSAIGLTCAIRRMGVPAYTVAKFHDPNKTNAKTLFDRFEEYDTPVAIEPEEALRFITPKSVLIIVDTHILKKLEDAELYEKADKNRVVIIDHHRLSAGAITEFAVRCQESSASSASELVTELVQYFGLRTPLKAIEAEALLAGITLDTRDFVMRSGVSTFEAAAYLKKLGADTISVKKLFDMPIDQKMKKAEIISAATIYRARCAIAVVADDYPGIRVLCSQAADEMLYIRNVDASFSVYPIDNGWSISARSFGKVNVQVIMESLGNKKDDGGGHQSMAGAQLYEITLDEAIDRLHTAIDDYFNNTAEDSQ